MIIGVPKEIKPFENRIAIVPGGVELLVSRGHKVYIEKNAGLGSGFSNESFLEAGAELLDTPAAVYERSQMILKVKEPLPAEYKLLREGQIVFTYFHFAASRELTEAVIDSKCIAIAYETVEAPDRSLPLLVPMSEVAGRLSIQAGARCLEKHFGGFGILLGGVPGVEPAKVTIIGGGVVGTNAAKIAAGMGAHVTILDLDLERLRYLDDVMPRNVQTLMSDPGNIRKSISKSHLVVGGVLIPGAKAPRLITKDMLKGMIPGSVIVDVAVDQGGCVETIHATTHDNPTYVIDGVVHYGVANMPGAVPHTSTVALTNSTLKYALKIADHDFPACLNKSPDIASGVNIVSGHVTYKGVADAFGLPYRPLDEIV